MTLRRLSALSLLPLLACQAGPDEFTHGEVLASLGHDPLGGRYNPRLAGCTIERELRSGEGVWTDTSEYDALGRLVQAQSAYLAQGESEEQLEISSSVWDGPCRHSVEVVSEDLTTWTEKRCEAQGWPTESVTRQATAGGEPLVTSEMTYANAYEGEALRQREVTIIQDDAPAETRTYEYDWQGNRLTTLVIHADATFTYGYTYREDGRVEHLAQADANVDWVYDDAGRLVEYVRVDSMGTRSTLITWVYEDDAEWPSEASWLNDEPASFHFDCP